MTEIIGTGKIVLSPIENKNWRFPVFHFAVLQETDDSFTAICIELLTEATANTIEEAVEMMTSSTVSLLQELSADPDNMFQVFTQMVSDNAADDLWQGYRLAKLNHSMNNQIPGRYLSKRVIHRVIASLPVTGDLSLDLLEYRGKVA